MGTADRDADRTPRIVAPTDSPTDSPTYSPTDSPTDSPTGRQPRSAITCPSRLTKRSTSDSVVSKEAIHRTTPAVSSQT